jgi:hypothetical protein
MFTYTLWGSDDIVQAAPRELRLVGVRSVAKRLEPHSPIEFANEFIGQELGRAVGIPVIRGERVWRNNEPWFCSFKFNANTPEQLPSKISPTAAATACPFDSAGIIIFDAWLHNHDRHDKNLGFDEDAPQIFALDHGRSLFHSSRPAEEMPHRRHGFDFATHCLVPHVSQLDDFVEWFWRILAIPADFIRRTLSAAIDFGLPEECVEMGVNFLVNRRLRLITMIEDNQGLFKKTLDVHDEFRALCTFTREFQTNFLREAMEWLA